ncbi:hypothetical protein [uncultured Tateyamaria sp.]|uniref:hypothetical protein n=1 Tax=uncultured Tateyamaria sp. TaxID=455651 RepID=UPI002602453A|nr:hypothetical protein [uncultured Tateyamaria sp.]
MMNPLLPGVLVLTLATSTMVSSEEDEGYFLLTREVAECIAVNRAQLALQDSSVVFIKPQECLTDVTEDVPSYAPAEAPDVRLLQTDEALDVDALIFLSRAQLACFADLSVLASETAGAQDIWRFYPDTCHFAPDA